MSFLRPIQHFIVKLDSYFLTASTRVYARMRHAGKRRGQILRRADALWIISMNVRAYARVNYQGVYIRWFTVRNPLLSCPLVLAQDGGTRSRQKCLHRDFSAPVLFWVFILGEAILDIKHGF